MIEPLVIRGVACPYDGLAVVDDGIHETIAPGALVPAGAVQLLYGNHDGRPMCSTSDGSLALWSEPIGLVFEARIDPSRRYARGMYDAICRGSFDGCSINMMIEDVEETMVGGVPHRRVLRASVDHVCISNGIAYADTAVWPAAAELDDLPPRVRSFALAWGRGDHLQTHSARSAPAPRMSSSGLTRARFPRAGWADTPSSNSRAPESVNRVLARGAPAAYYRALSFISAPVDTPPS